MEALMKDQGEWVTEKLELKNLALSFFTKLFMVEPTSGAGTFIRAASLLRVRNRARA